MREHVAFDQQPLELVLAPAAMERRGMKLRDRGGVARRCVRQHGLAAREQAREKSHHRRGRRAASCGCASGARR
jgi:hypothetical protein